MKIQNNELFKICFASFTKIDRKSPDGKGSMDTGLSPFRMELVLTEFYVARGGPVLRPSMKCTVHESRAHLNGEEGRLMVLLLLLHAVHIAQYWENQSLADRPIASRTKRRRPPVARFEWFAMSRFVRRSIFSPLSLSSFFLVFPYRVWTTHIYTYTYAILRSLSPLLPLPFYHFPLSFSSFSPIICLCFFLSLLFLLVELTCFFVFLNRTLHDRSSLSIGLSSLQSAVIFSCRSYFRRAHPTSSPEAALHGLFSAHCLEAPAEVTGFPG